MWDMAYYMWKTTTSSLTSASLDLCILMGPQSCRRQVSLLNDCFVSQLCWRASKGCRAERQEGTHLRLGMKRKKRRGGGRQHFRSWLFYGCLAHDSSFFISYPFLVPLWEVLVKSYEEKILAPVMLWNLLWPFTPVSKIWLFWMAHLRVYVIFEVWYLWEKPKFHSFWLLFLTRGLQSFLGWHSLFH